MRKKRYGGAHRNQTKGRETDFLRHFQRVVKRLRRTALWVYGELTRNLVLTDSRLSIVLFLAASKMRTPWFKAAR
ncbi:hypothetical protein [Moorena sp. SIO3F7]|uniref:hypothetical protein n=1 Tax=Moorena TaxID=1155738 RepID=UPI001400FD4A|nr:hypothetical protein [Moorena sp. SIO3F7]NEP99189.1 hypothetical protein [Moorena sp. SIO3F7]